MEALNEDPSPIEALTIPGVVEHLESIVGQLENPDHHGPLGWRPLYPDPARSRLRSCWVAIDSRAAEGVLVTPVSQIRVFPDS